MRYFFKYVPLFFLGLEYGIAAELAPQIIDTVAFAENMVTQLRPNEKVAKYKPGRPTVLMAMPMEFFRTVPDYGIASLLETGRSSANDNVKKRLEAMKWWPYRALGFSESQWNPTSLHPKSAFLLNTPLEEGNGLREDYGDVLMTFKPSVFKRMTWTESDMYHGGLGVKRLGDGDRIPDINKRLGEYMEAQIWGRTTLGDVESVYVEKEIYEKNVLFFSEIRQFGPRIFTFQRQANLLGYAMKNVSPVEFVGLATKGIPYSLPAPAMIYRFQNANEVEQNIIINRLGEIGDDVSIRFLKSLLAKTDPIYLSWDKEKLLNLNQSAKPKRLLMLQKALTARADTLSFFERISANQALPSELRAVAHSVLDTFQSCEKSFIKLISN